ncbi:MAG: hypothetical protein HQ522_11980, partial [Bacteroidetes bacterium]|nr:hypothetical protein [Bacteroidota bacterium]
MSKFQDKIKNYTQIFYWIFVFVVTTSMLFLILPGEPKFKYEYQKGFPWRHDNLVAPFDFAILKTTQEVENEKADQIKTIISYFTCDTSLSAQNINRLKSDLNVAADSIEPNKIIVFNILQGNL